MSSNKKNLDPTIIAALIGLAGTIIVSIFTYLATRPEPQTIVITSTPLVVLESSAISASVSLPAETSTPTEVVQVNVPTETPFIVPSAPVISQSCLEGWNLINSSSLGTTFTAKAGCGFASIPELGIATNETSMLFTPARFRETGIFGVSVPLPENATVTLNVRSDVVYNAEFWVALSNTPTPDTNAVILAFDPASGNQAIHPGSIRTYLDDAKSRVAGYEWFMLNEQTQYPAAPPYLYAIELQVLGGNVNIRVNGILLDSQIVSFPRYLFLGYRNKTTSGSVTMNVTISNLSITP